MAKVKLVGFRLLDVQIKDLHKEVAKRGDGISTSQLVREIVAEWLRRKKDEQKKLAKGA